MRCKNVAPKTDQLRKDMLGITETIVNNFDLLFRYLYFVAFILQVGIQFTLKEKTFTYGGSVFVFSVIIMVSFVTTLFAYRKKQSNIQYGSVVWFYLKCVCCRTKYV